MLVTRIWVIFRCMGWSNLNSRSSDNSEMVHMSGLQIYSLMHACGMCTHAHIYMTCTVCAHGMHGMVKLEFHRFRLFQNVVWVSNFQSDAPMYYVCMCTYMCMACMWCTHCMHGMDMCACTVGCILQGPATERRIWGRTGGFSAGTGVPWWKEFLVSGWSFLSRVSSSWMSSCCVPDHNPFRNDSEHLHLQC